MEKGSFVDQYLSSEEYETCISVFHWQQNEKIRTFSIFLLRHSLKRCSHGLSHPKQESMIREGSWNLSGRSPQKSFIGLKNLSERFTSERPDCCPPRRGAYTETSLVRRFVQTVYHFHLESQKIYFCVLFIFNICLIGYLMLSA